MKRMFLLLALPFVIYACGGAPTGEESAEVAVTDISIAMLVEEPMEYEGETVRLDGIIDHMCRHSGDKMRVAQLDDDEVSIQVRLGEFMNQFSVELEGSIVSIVGVLHTEVLNMEELEHHDEGHDCESTEEAVQLMAERGIDPNIRPYIELQWFEIH